MYIGIDLGGTNIAVGIVGDDAKIIATDSTPTMAERDYTEIVKDMAAITKKVLAENKISVDDIKGIGIGCPGTIDNKNGIVVYANNFKMKKVPLAAEMKKYINKPVSLINDADAAAFGEYIVNGNGCDSFLFITLGTGVGGGIVLGGKVYNGFNSAGGELGHITLVHGGLLCTCGNEGCWEAYASVSALIRQTKAAMDKNPTSLMHKIAKKDGKVSGRTAFDAAKAGDEAGKKVVGAYCEYVASGLVGIVNIFQPQKIVIGGGISKEGDYLLGPIVEYWNKRDYNKYMPKTEISIATLFNDAGIIGAAFACME